MADVLSSLRVVLGLDSAALNKGLKDAEGSFKRFAKSATTIAAGIKLEQILTSAVRGITSAIKDSVFAADQMGKMAQKVGMPVDEFSKLAYAAKLADVPLETLQKSLIFLSKEMAEAAVAGSPTAKLFHQIGLEAEITKGVLKPLPQMFTEVVEKLDSYTEGAAKNAIQVKLLGKAGAELSPMIDGGAASIKRAGEELAKFGGVITQDMFNASQNFKDNLDRLGTVANGVALQIAGPLAEALSEVSNQLVDTAKNTDFFQLAGKAVGETVIWLTAQIQKLMASARALGEVWTALRNIMNAPLGAGIQAALDKEAAAFREIESNYKAAQATFQQNVNSPWKPVVDDFKEMNRQLETGFRQWLKIKPPIVDTGNAASGAAKGLTEAEKALEKIHEEGKQTTESVLTPMEQYEKRVKELDLQLAATAITAETYAKAISKAKNEMIQADPVTRMLKSSLSSAFDKVLDGATDFQTILRELIRDFAKMAAQAAFKALLFGSPTQTSGSGLLGGLIAGGGGNLFKFAGGGSFRVGGSGGVDSQLVAFKASPGEQVDVRTKGQQREMDAQAVTVDGRTRIINAFDGPSFLSEALNSPTGEKVILNFVRANPGAFRAALTG